ncbi:type II toxin-antitoxin system PemK/MazF family toxin [Cellulomonas telluris]|uniref:type II toxin-antitoxin system PemK/MazF family toxin n=1 Tax=Cellulomonas telluris TaxID=2306636 RepID=UPI0010A7E8E5|nr:type II toxin-antitoxin system PemK/MazF family toxin [Cellulomonas telluris]
MSRRGDVWLVDLDPARGREANKTRPVVVVSNQAAVTSAFTAGRGVVTVVPLTSNVARVLPFQAYLPAGDTGLEVDSKARAEQVRSVDVGRFVELVGVVPPVLMRDVDRALRLHLSL